MSRSFSIVDAHVHFWNPQRLNYPWLAELPGLNRAFLPADFQAAAKTDTAEKLIFVECGCEAAQNGDEVKWISQLAAHETRIRGIVAHAPVERGASVRPELAALAQFPLVKGVRRNFQGETVTDFCAQPEFVAGVRALAEFNFSFDLCLLHHQLPAAIELVRRCPEINFILDHCGKPAIRAGQVDPWQRQIRELAALPNVVCKISGLLTEAKLTDWQPADLQPFVRHTVECFGFDRVMFGGDWPVLTLAGDYSRWLAALDFCLPDAGESERQKLFQTTAEKVYRI